VRISEQCCSAKAITVEKPCHNQNCVWYANNDDELQSENKTQD